MNTTNQRPTIDPTQKTHRPDPFMWNNGSYCIRCGDSLQQTGRGIGYTHSHDWFNVGKRVAGVLPPTTR